MTKREKEAVNKESQSALYYLGKLLWMCGKANVFSTVYNAEGWKHQKMTQMNTDELILRFKCSWVQLPSLK